MTAAIKSAQIKNFQSHADTEIEFAPAGQLTVLIGPSDNGKTAVFRAVRWTAYNEPRGTDFIRVGTNQARITIVLADGRKVVRERSRKGFNRYILRDAEGKEQIFEGFGDAVPLEVQETLGIRPVAVGDLELNLNLAEQLEGPFLGKSVSAPAKAKILGKLAGTEEVDLAVKQLNTDLYRRRQDEKNLNAEITGLREELKKYDYLPELEKTISQVGALLAAVKDNQQKKDRLEKLREGLQKTDQRIKFCTAIIDSLEMFILAAEPPAGKVEISMMRRDRLTAEKRKLDEIAAGITAAQDVITRTAGILEADQNIHDVQIDVGTLDILKELQAKLGTAIGGIRSAEAVLGKTETIPEAERLHALAAIAAERATRLRAAAGNLDNVNRQIERCIDVIDRLRPAAEAEPATALVSDKIRQLTNLRPLAVNFKNVNSELRLCVEKINRLAFVADAENDLKNLEGRYGKLDSLIAKQDGLQHLSRDAADMAAAAGRYAAMVQTLQNEYQDLLVSIGICPTCGAEITQFRLKEVV